MQFIEDGPDVPEHLLREHAAGNVVFVVGTGLSMPAGLPSFSALVDRVYGNLSLDLPGVPNSLAPWAEVEAYGRHEFDRVLGLLERRVVYAKPSRPNQVNRVRDAVAEILQGSGRKFEIQRDLLEIASDGSGRPRLITTNFDLLFEEAWKVDRAEPLSSLSGTALPPVGSSGFAGIMHLHGRIEDRALGLEASDLVLTSGDFGEAYLRSGWASRYVYDLLRRYTLVFVGYSADDPPMRYMLEAAEAGRVRFPDIRRAYAFAPSDRNEDGRIRERWRAKGLTPIVYSDHDDHRALSETIRAWAESCRNPIAWASAQIADLTSVPFEAATDLAKAKVSFLATTTVDANVLSQHAASCDWIECLLVGDPAAQQGQVDQGVGRLVVWMRGRLEDERAVSWALKTSPGIQIRLADAVRWLLPSVQLREPFRLFWLLYCDAHRTPRDASARLGLYTAKASLAKGVVDYSILTTVAEALRPRISLSPPFREDRSRQPTQVSDIARCRFACSDAHACKEALSAWPRDKASLSRLIEALDRVLADTFEYLRQFDGPASSGDDYVHIGLVHPFEEDEPRTFNPDRHSRSLSWQENEPDQHDDSFAPIVRTMTAAWQRLADVAAVDAEHVAERWLIRTETTFRRMGMWASRNSTGRLFDRAQEILRTLDRQSFWLNARNPEYARFWCRRWQDFDGETRINIEDRIIEGPETGWLVFAQGDEDEGARLRRMMVHRELTRIKTSGGVLSEKAEREIDKADAIDPALPSQVAPVEGLYPISWSGWGPDGDVSAVRDVAADTLLDRVAEIETADPVNQNGLWDKLCAERPDDAWAALQSSAARNEWNGRRWSTFIINRVSSTLQENADPALLNQAFDYLMKMPAAPFEAVARTATGLVRTVSERSNAQNIPPSLLPLWDRLLSHLCNSDLDHEEVTSDAHSQAINRPTGHLAATLVRLLYLEDHSARGVGIPDELSMRFLSLLELAEPMRTLALHVMAADLFLFNFVAPDWTSKHVLSEIDRDGASAASLLDSWVRFGSEKRDVQLFNRLRRRVEVALTDATTATQSREYLAYLVTWASFTTLSGNKDIDFTPTDARRVLSRCSPNALKAIAWSLWRSVGSASPDEASETWITQIEPFLERVWPIDVDTLSPEISATLIRIPQACGASFEKAVDRISVLIVPTRLDSVMFGLNVHDDERVFRDDPAALLRLAWEAIDLDLLPAPFDLETFLTKIGGSDAALKATWRFRRLSSLLRHV